MPANTSWQKYAAFTTRGIMMPSEFIGSENAIDILDMIGTKKVHIAYPHLACNK